MEKLCTDVLENVLCRLPIERALQAKRVCKTWRFLLRSKTDKVGLLFFFSYYKDKNENKLCYGDQLYDPISGKMDYSYSYDKLDTMHNGMFLLHMDRMLGSCNGLVCIRTYYEQSFLVCNPLTGEVVYPPKPNKSTLQDCYRPIDFSGFGYCHSTNEYKIVRIHKDYRELKKKYHVQVYTVGGGGEWRTKESINFQRITNKQSLEISPLYVEGVYADGSIHWLHRRRRKNTHCDDQNYTIAAFDLEDEAFRFLPLPHLEDAKYLHRPNSAGPNLLGPRLMGGKNLYFVDTFYDEHHTDIWAYKRTNANSTDRKENNYSDKNLWHWIKEFSIEWEEPLWEDLWTFAPMAITSNNELLLRRAITLYCYDLKTSTWKELFDGYAEGCNMICAIPHVNSIVSISLQDRTDGQDRQLPLEDSREHGCDVGCNMINVIPHANNIVANSLRDHADGHDRQSPLNDSMAHGNYSYVYAYGALFFLLAISFKFLFPHFLDR